MSNPDEIYIWPDGTWVRADEYEDIEYQSFGDDFFGYNPPANMDDEEIDAHVCNMMETCHE